jgi:hypothetical protein
VDKQHGEILNVFLQNFCERARIIWGILTQIRPSLEAQEEHLKKVKLSL